jgi:hypothetical protein
LIQRFFISVFLCGFAYQSLAQSNLHLKKIAAQGLQKLDSASIVANSVVVQGVHNTCFIINWQAATIHFICPQNIDSVWIQYRVFPISFSKIIQRYNYDSIKNNFVALQPFSFNSKANIDAENDNKKASFGNITYSGILGRSLSFGNNSDAVFNSQLHLQINGLIGDSIELSAAITDNNIPIQPDGNTKQLNEFDKILIQFKKQNWALSLGDIDVKQKDNYFLNFYKRLQGISFNYDSYVFKNSSNQFFITGAIAKGKFARNSFDGLEGNQGPYKLKAPNNELYFIVLAGTEKVFIDGQLLQRGDDKDYIINYNTAEISFTPKQMITKDKRIQIEFEYADRNYLNLMLFAQNKIAISKKLSVTIAAYNNNDAKNSPINQQLDSKQKQFLANIGNQTNQAFYPYESIDTFSTFKILYSKQANPINSLDSIYVYSTNRDSAKYSLFFTEVGNNKGNYTILINGSNGKVYKWVPPINNVPQGNYSPAQFLVTPKQLQIATINTQYTINKNTLAKLECAFSNYDANTLSTIDKENNKGTALKFMLDKTNKISSQLNLHTQIGYEYIHKNFTTIERLRTPEFNRDWGLPIFVENTTQHLPTLALELKNNANNFAKLESSGYLASNNFSATKQSLLIEKSIEKWQTKSSFFWVASNANNAKGSYIKTSFDATKTMQLLGNIKVGVGYLLDNSNQKFTANDSLLPTSFWFETISAFIKSNEEKSNKISVDYYTRTNKIAQNTSFINLDKSHNFGIAAQFFSKSQHQLQVTFTYRTLETFNSNLKKDNSLLGKISYYFNAIKNLIKGNIDYELGAGQEQKREYSFIEVPVGRGQYTWIDYNNDAIAQINEFEVAQFTDQAKYIKIFTPTNQYIKANYNLFTYSFQINPRNISSAIGNKTWKHFLSNITLQTSFQISKKNLSQGLPNINIFDNNQADSLLISQTNLLSNTLSYNRNSNIWGIEISNLQNNNKALLTYGFESRNLNQWNLKVRYNFKNYFSVELLQKLGSNKLLTPYFNNQNYWLQTNSIEPKIIYTYYTKFRLQASWQYQTKTNIYIALGESSTSNSLLIDAKYNAVQSTSIAIKFTYNHISFVGKANTATSFIMLEGLLPGKNYLWSIDFTKRLSNSLELVLSYEARKPGEANIINTGRASIRAIL